MAYDGSGVWVIGRVQRVEGDDTLRSWSDRYHCEGRDAFAAAHGGRRRGHAADPACCSLGLLLAGFVLRVAAARTTWGQPDGDDAMVMLMSLRVSQGHFSLLFWGGNYGGADHHLGRGATDPRVRHEDLALPDRRHGDEPDRRAAAAVRRRAVSLREPPPTSRRARSGSFPHCGCSGARASTSSGCPRPCSRSRRASSCSDGSSPGVGAISWRAVCARGLRIWSYPLVFPLVGPALVVLVVGAAQRPARGWRASGSPASSASPRGSRTSSGTGDRRRSCRPSPGTGSPT